MDADLCAAIVNLDIRNFKHHLRSTLGRPGEGGIRQGTRESLPILIQILEAENIAVPSYDRDTVAKPRMLLMKVTDGKQVLRALEMEDVKGLTSDVRPGTKILLTSGGYEVSKGTLLLRNSNACYLGGHVSDLVMQWKAKRLDATMMGMKCVKDAPPFVEFGEEIKDGKDTGGDRARGKEEPENVAAVQKEQPGKRRILVRTGSQGRPPLKLPKSSRIQDEE